MSTNIWVKWFEKIAFPLSEFPSAIFPLFAIGSLVVVNALELAKHKKTATTVKITLDAKTGSATVAEVGVILSSVEISQMASGTYTEGKVYLSPVIDCLDGLPVAWTVETHPDEQLVNEMQLKATAQFTVKITPEFDSFFPFYTAQSPD